MIPRAHITAWRSKAPWSTDAQVEQDLVICRAIVELFSDEFLTDEVAFRGGTALHKLHFDPPSRYSEDIDLVQVNAGPIGPIMDAVRARLDPWLGKPQWKQGKGRATFYYRFESETKPVTPLKLKVETNTREHFFVLGPRRVHFEVKTPGTAVRHTCLPTSSRSCWARNCERFTRGKRGETFSISRRHSHGLTGLDPEKVVACLIAYLDNDGRRVTRAVFERNIVEKIEDKLFLSDVLPLLAHGVSYDPVAALERIRDAFISRLPEGASTKKKERRRR